MYATRDVRQGNRASQLGLCTVDRGYAGLRRTRHILGIFIGIQIRDPSTRTCNNILIISAYSECVMGRN